MDQIKSGGCVYILKTGNKLYKIGKSEDLNERIAAYKTHLPSMFEVVRQYMADNSDELEQGLHTVFQHKRVKGEWFKMKKTDVEICDNIAHSYAIIKLHKQKNNQSKIKFSENPHWDAYQANLKYLEDYAMIVRDLKLGLKTDEIIELYQGAISKTTIQTIKRLLKNQTPNGEFVSEWYFLVDDLVKGMTIDEIVLKYKGAVSKTIVQTIRRILKHHLY